MERPPPSACEQRPVGVCRRRMPLAVVTAVHPVASAEHVVVKTAEPFEAGHLPVVVLRN